MDYRAKASRIRQRLQRDNMDTQRTLDCVVILVSLLQFRRLKTRLRHQEQSAHRMQVEHGRLQLGEFDRGDTDGPDVALEKTITRNLRPTKSRLRQRIWDLLQKGASCTDLYRLWKIWGKSIDTILLADKSINLSGKGRLISVLAKIVCHYTNHYNQYSIWI